LTSLLTVTDRPFWLRNRGDLQRIAALTDYLLDGGLRLQFLFVRSPRSEGSASDLPSHYRGAQIDTVIGGVKGRARFARGKRAGNKRDPLMMPEPNMTDFVSPSVRRAFGRRCRALLPDVVLVHYIRLAYVLDELPRSKPTPLTLIDTFDVMSSRCRQFHNVGERHWVNISEEEERELLRRFDYVLAIQKRDAEEFRDMLPGGRILTVGHACPIVRHPVRRSPPIVLTYVATSGPANRLALAGFLSNVWPRLVDRFGPMVKLRIVGRVCRSVPAVISGDVQVLGEVEDLTDVYANADICINPVVFGGGLKIKNVEALANCKPLVTTSVGAEGLEDGIGRAFLVCNTPEETVQELVALISDSELRRRMSAEARDFAEIHFSQEAAYGELKLALGGISH